MKLSELKPCDKCGGKIAPVFYVVNMQQVMIDAVAANRTLALNQMFGGALGLAENMSPDDSVTQVLNQKRAIICQECFFGSNFNVWLFDRDDDD